MKKFPVSGIPVSSLLIMTMMSLFSCGEEDQKDKTVTDIDGNVYGTVLIGEQRWMSENLKTTHLNDGTIIPHVVEDTAWFSIRKSELPAYCWYDNLESGHGEEYGILYNWYAVNTGNLCPAGWHVPSDDEWDQLTDYLGGEKISGGKLKESGTVHWLVPNLSATNDSGFTALPAGYREPFGQYRYIGETGFLWSSDRTSNDFNQFGLIRVLDYLSGATFWDGLALNMGASVRCLKD